MNADDGQFPFGWSSEEIRDYFADVAKKHGIPFGEPRAPVSALDIPPGAFISHAYADEANLHRLLDALPPDFEPVIQAPIDVPPTEFVSTPIFEAVRSAPALIYVAEGDAGASPWVAIERDQALRAGKPVFAFHPSTLEFTRNRRPPKRLAVHGIAASADVATADSIIAWMAENRDFHVERFSHFADMGEYAGAVMDFGGIFLGITGRASIRELPVSLVRVACEPDDGWPSRRMILACLDPPGPWIPERVGRYVMQDGVIDLTDGGASRPWSANRLDDLIARIVWLS